MIRSHPILLLPLIVVLPLMLSSCDTFHGLYRYATLNKMPAQSCVINTINNLNEVSLVNHSAVDKSPSSYSYSYTYHQTNVDVYFGFSSKHARSVDYSSTAGGGLACQPTTIPFSKINSVMIQVEKAIGEKCHIKDLLISKIHVMRNCP